MVCQSWGSFPGLLGSRVFFPFYHFGITTWNRLPFHLSFCCCLLVVWREVKKRLLLVTPGAGERLAGIRLLQVTFFFSLSMEELRSYCHIPDNIDFELPDGPAKSTIDKEDGAIYFTRE